MCANATYTDSLSKASEARERRGFEVTTDPLRPCGMRRLLATIWVSLFKDTSLVSLVGLKDLAGEGASIYRDSFRQIEVMAVLALIYFALTYPQSIFINRLFEKYRVRE